MDTPSTPARPVIANETNQRRPGSLCETTPRAMPSHKQTMMEIFQQHAATVQPPATPPKSAKPTAQAQAYRKPQCTHMTMNRVYGAHPCQICHRVPTLGFVYVCQQDKFIKSQACTSESDAMPVVPDSDDFFEAQAKIAESLGMSASVIKQMRAKAYSFDQVETLLAQKRNVIKIIKQMDNPSAESSPTLPNNPRQTPSESVIASVGATPAPTVQQVGASALPMSPAGTPCNTPGGSTTSSPMKSRNRLGRKQPCEFQVCHSCRPFMKERVPSSFGFILNEMPPVAEEEVANLKISDAKIVRNIGLRDSPPKSSMATMQQADGVVEEYSDDSTPTSISMTESQNLEELFPCPGPGICPLASGTDGCAYSQGFNDGKRAFNHGFFPSGDHDADMARDAKARFHGRRVGSASSSAGSSISLPEQAMPLTPSTSMELPVGLTLSDGITKPGKAATICGVMIDGEKTTYSHGAARKYSSSSVGSEVEVEGGVALTEEAVGTGMPDIVTAD